MVLSGVDKEQKLVIITCKCGCGSEITITKFINEDNVKEPVEYYMSVNSSLFGQEQMGLFKLIKTRLKRMWYDLIGKNYLYLDICLNEQQLQQLIDKLQDLQK